MPFKLLVFAGLIVSLAMALPIHAAFFNPGCAAGVGDAAALQSAITTASSNGQVDLIELGVGCIYTLSTTLVIGADAGNLLTIKGNGATLNGNNSVRVFDIVSGAAVAINSLTVTLGNSTGFGGGILNAGTLSLTESQVNSNRTTSLGGGIFNSGTLTLTDSTINSNEANSSGGMFNNGGTVTLIGSTIRGNTAGSVGGFNSQAGTVTLTNSTVTLNSVTGGVGAFQGSSGAVVTLNNSTVAANSAGTNSGVQNFATMVINNSIVANHTGVNCIGMNVSVSHSIIEGGGCGVTNGVNGNLTGDPALGAITGNPAYYPIATGSIAVGAGDNALIPGSIKIDQAGNERIYGATVDMGAFEADCMPFPYNVPAGNTMALYAAVDCANNTPANDLILLTNSAYTLSKTLYVDGDGLTINGNGATLDAGGFFNVFIIPGGDVTLRSMTIANGSGIAGGGIAFSSGSLNLIDITFHQNEATGDGLGGGALVNRQGSVNIINCIFSQNGSSLMGGAIENDWGTINVTDSVFDDNHAARYGGAIWNYNNSLMMIKGSTFHGNESELGGAIYSSGAYLEVTDSSFQENTADNGGGIHSFGTLRVIDSTFSDNAAAIDGGAISNGQGVMVTNSTFNGNSAGGHGGAILNAGGFGIYNSTFSENSAVSGGALYNGGYVLLHNSILANSLSGGDCVRVDRDISAENSLIEDGLTCVNGTNTSNLTGDPRLGTLTGSPAYYPLLHDSVALDAGSNELVPTGTSTDIRGSSRIANGTVDMGSYEAGIAPMIIVLELQGRPERPDPSYAVTVHVQFREVGSTTPVFSQDFIVSDIGILSFLGPVEGEYDLWIKGTHTLAVLDRVLLDSVLNLLSTNALPEGDADDSNTVILTDFSLLAAAFGTATGNPNFNPQADFNGDGQVQLIDFSLLASNFNQAGAP